MRKLVKIFPFLVWFRLITIETIKADFIAGLTGAIIVLPQSVAFVAPFFKVWHRVPQKCGTPTPATDASSKPLKN